MRDFRLSWFLPLLAIGLWFAAGDVCKAQEIRFPEKSPLVSFTLPDGWLTDEEDSSPPIVRDCHLSVTAMFRIRLFQDLCSDADFKQKMPAFIKANLNSFGIDPTTADLGPVNVTTRPLNDKIQAAYCEVKLKSMVVDEPYLLRVAGFTVGGKSMLVLCGAEGSALKSGSGSNPNFDKILSSLKPIK